MNRNSNRKRAQNRAMRVSLTAVMVLLGYLDIPAQITISVTDLPHRAGQSSSAWFRTNVPAIHSLLGDPGGPRRWDFSEPRRPEEAEQRLDVVAAEDAGRTTEFPEATYAERLTEVATDMTSWSYYHVDPAAGRSYYGFYTPIDQPADSLVSFDAPPPLDRPASITYGEHWSWQATYGVEVLGFPVEALFRAGARADAYGTVVLPNLGELPALRVIETNVTEFSFAQQPLGSVRNTNYYWMVRGIGAAVQIRFFGNNPQAPAALPFTNSMVRVFEASDVPDRLRSAQDVRLRLHNGDALLSWRGEANDSKYRVETRASLSSGGWEVLTDTTTVSWSERFHPEVRTRFYRVLIEP